MIKIIYGKVLDVLSKKPFRLWGISLLAVLLTSMTPVFAMLPIVIYPIIVLLQLGMAMVFLSGYRGGDCKAEDLFTGFKNFWHNIAGLAWKDLWIMLWSLIPVVGPIFCIIKTYAYRFVPYLLAENPDMKPTDAKKISEEKAEGFKGKMFLADLALAGAFIVITVVLCLLCLIPYVCYLFYFILFVFTVVFLIVAPLISGLVSAAFYEEVASGRGSEEFAAYAMQKKMEAQLKNQMKQQMEEMKRQQMEQIKAQQLQLQQQQQQQMQQMQQQMNNQQPPEKK